MDNLPLTEAMVVATIVLLAILMMAIDLRRWE